MKQLTVTRSTSERVPNTTSYRMDIAVTEAQNTTRYVFVKQRITTVDPPATKDVFVAVATPTQQEDLCEDVPCEGDTYFLTTSVQLINEDPEYLEQVFDTILVELRQLVGSLEVLSSTSATAAWTITGDAITPIV